MNTHTVRILIDGEARSVEPGTYTIAQLGLRDVAELTLSETPFRPQVIGGNDSFEIRGGESFTTRLRNGEHRTLTTKGATDDESFQSDAALDPRVPFPRRGRLAPAE
jgi:hypothetical protein